MMTRLTLLFPPALVAAALMNGCASPEPRYYTLAASPANAAAAVTGRASRTGGPLWIEVTPVRVPERLNRAQLVVRDGTGRALSSCSTHRAGRLHCRTSYAMRCRSTCNRVLMRWMSISTACRRRSPRSA